MQKHYHSDLDKYRQATKQKVARFYHKNLSQSRAISRSSTARQYIKDLDSSRVKSKYRSALTYGKRATTVRRGKRDRYSLAEPKKQEVTCLIKHFQNMFYKNKKVVSKIMKGLKKLNANLNLEKGPAGRYAVCKLASGHLVRFALRVRRKAVGAPGADSGGGLWGLKPPPLLPYHLEMLLYTEATHWTV